MKEQCKLKYTINIVKGVDLASYKVECDRPAVHDGLCYLHSAETQKEIGHFQREIVRLSEQQGKYIDLSYFVFPDEPFEFPVTIRKGLLCEHTQFRGDVSFRGHQFPEYTSFHSATFHGVADFGYDRDPYRKYSSFYDTVVFNSVQFHKRTMFASCEFKMPPQFMGTIFHDLVVFSTS